MRFAALFLVAVSVLAFAGCLQSSRSPVEGSLTIPNSLGYGSDDDGILVEFVRVENDSRCAEGVQCVRAGEAFVVLSATVDGGTPTELRAEMVPQGSATLEADRFTITVLSLTPDPPPVGGVEQSQYEIQLRIEE